MYTGLHVKYPIFLSDRTETRISSKDFQKYSNKFRKYQASGSLVVPYGRVDRQIDMTKLIIAFRNSENAPKRLPHQHLPEEFPSLCFPSLLNKYHLLALPQGSCKNDQFGFVILYVGVLKLKNRQTDFHEDDSGGLY